MQHIDEFFKDTNQQFTLENVNAANGWAQLQQQQITIAKKRKFQKFVISGSMLVVVLASLFYINTKNNKPTNNSLVTTPNQQFQNTKLDTNTNQNSTTVISKAQPNPPSTLSNTAINSAAKNNEIILDNTSFYIDLSKEPELFSLKEKSTFTTKGGATIQISPNALQSNIADQDITMTVQEYYKKESNTGMIKYHFYKNDTLLDVETSNAITVQFPKTNNHKQIVFYNQADNVSDAVLQKMQWASTEKFITDKSNKVNYKITLPAQYNAQTFLSVLAFVNQKVLVAGDVVKNSIVFNNIPKDEPVYFISIGRTANNYFICNKKLITSNAEIKALNFLETSQEFYTKKYEELSALSTTNQ